MLAVHTTTHNGQSFHLLIVRNHLQHKAEIIF